MRDIIAALLRDRGYVHDDASDPDDEHWSSPRLGVRPLLVCVAHEMNCDLAKVQPSTSGYLRYDLSLAAAVRGVAAPTEDKT